MSPTSRLEVIAHEGTRTGSPVVLLGLLRRARAAIDRPISVRLLAEGPLADDLRGLATVSDPGTPPGLVLVNSALGADALADYPSSVPAIVYVHEVGDALRTLPAGCRAALAERADVVLAVSEAAASDLVDLGVDRGRIELLAPLVTVELAGAADVEAARAELGVPDEAALVLGCGEAGWRKGADLFVDVCARLGHDRIAFAWVGRRPRSFARMLDADCAATRLGGRLRWIGEVPNTGPFLAAADVVVMTSREDPQPLVPMEAARHGTPTAGFDLGGLGDMAAVGAAEVVGYPDTRALAAATGMLLSDPDRRTAIVDAARTWVSERHSPDVIVPRFVDAVRRVLDRPVSGVAGP